MAKRRLLTLALVLLVSALAQAAPLNLVQNYPDMAAFYLDDITYDATGDTFHVSHINATTLLELTPKQGSKVQYASGVYDLTAQINDQGELLSGTLTLTDASTSTLLLSADLTDFGFVPDGSVGTPVFEFIGTTTGGSLEPQFDDWGKGIGTIVSGASTFSGDFLSDYTSTASDGRADTFMNIPEPASMTLLLAGALALVARRRHRKRGA